jgi:TrmH family RNA methyltransferase
MHSPQYIESLQNPKLKEMVKLKEKSRARTQSGTFIIEGVRELSLAIGAGYHILSWYVQPQICLPQALSNLAAQLSKQQTSLPPIHLSQAVFEKVAQRSSTEGVIAIAQQKSHHLDALKITKKNPLILVAEAPEKPGNIGALLRTADAANLDALIIANPKSDLYNPNIIRSSVGGVFTVPVAMGSHTEVLQYLKSLQANVYAAALQASKPYTEVDFTEPTAIVVGTEATGLEAVWLEESNQNIRIPMQGAIDSMNVSVAAGIMIFEAVRQRSVL